MCESRQERKSTNTNSNHRNARILWYKIVLEVVTYAKIWGEIQNKIGSQILEKARFTL